MRPMTCRASHHLAIMFFALFAFSMLGFLIIKPITCTSQSPCMDGQQCTGGLQCCEQGCCDATTTSPVRRDKKPKDAIYISPWYSNWFVLFLLVTLGGVVIGFVCCLFFKQPSRREYTCSLACCVRRQTSEHDSAGSVYPPPHYSRCGSIHQAPPPYSEVTSKPDLYPLVITCGEGDGKASGNYLMVHYFRNYVIRAPGSLSATSTAESLNSSFLCNATNEANTIVPPPYSCASNYEEGGGVGCGDSLLRSLSSLTEHGAPAASLVSPTSPASPATPGTPAQPPLSAAPDAPSPRVRPTLETTSTRKPSQIFTDFFLDSPLDPPNDYDLMFREIFNARRPKVGLSPTAKCEHEMYGHCYTCSSSDTLEACQSPPRPTSPTETPEESTLRRYSDERRDRRKGVKKSSKSRKASLYMPLSVAYTSRSHRPSSSISAPTTPCSVLVPNLLTFSHRLSTSRLGSRSSRFQEESNPLLSEIENMRFDHKF